MTGAQEAMIAAIGIHEDSAKKLVGEKSITRVTQDYNGQTAFGIMNWIPDAANRYVGAEETKYGTTLAEQLPYVRQMYFDENPTHDRARVISANYDMYSPALQRILGHPSSVKPGEAWGPVAEADIAEAMAHYVANALVPAGWSSEDVLAAHMGTAAEAYNWMIDQGWITADNNNRALADIDTTISFNNPNNNMSAAYSSVSSADDAAWRKGRSAVVTGVDTYLNLRRSPSTDSESIYKLTMV